MSVIDLVRPDLRDFAGYSSARRAHVSGDVWLNANESPSRNPADHGESGCNRYPEPQPARLRAALASLYGVPETQLLIGRGSDEAIDLLLRALCRAGEDSIVIAPPVFGMYAVCARVQGAAVVEVPLRDEAAGFRPDLGTMADVALARGAKLLFLCSPGNPTGEALEPDAVLELARRLQDRCVVVVDEAYVEYADRPSLATHIDAQPNLAVLRTLSKAHALAAARIGVLLATPELIGVLRNCQAPYPVPTPCAELALAGLRPDALQRTRERVSETVAQRERVCAALSSMASVRHVYPSQGNYLLVRFSAADEAYERLLAGGVVVRDMRAAPQLGDALRISIGSVEENDRLLAALRSRRAVA